MFHTINQNILPKAEERVDWVKLLQDIKEQLHYSNNELAGKTGVTPSTIGNILNGNVIEPRQSFIRKLEAGLGIKINKEDSTFQLISTGAKEVKLPVIPEYNLRVMSMQYARLNAVREEIVPYTKETNVFLVEVSTDSMAPRILPGDRVLVDLDEIPKNDSTVLMLLKDGSRHLGKYNSKGDFVVVVFGNKDYSPTFVKKSEIDSIACVKKIVGDI